MFKPCKINFVAIFIILFCIGTIIKMRWFIPIETATSNGVIASVKEVKQYKNSCIIDVSFKKEDGTRFDDATKVGIFKLSVSNPFSGIVNESYSETYKLSHDGKELTYSFLLNRDSSAAGNRVEITLNQLIMTTSGEIMLDESIYDLYTQLPLTQDYHDEPATSPQNTAFTNGLIPIADVPNFSILGIGFNQNKDIDSSNTTSSKELLHIRTQLIENVSGIYNEAHIKSLYSEPTNEEVHYIFGSHSYIGHNMENTTYPSISEDYYPLTNTEKLKSIKPVISYTIKEVINDGSWTLKIKL